MTDLQGKPLSEREQQLCALLMEGYPNEAMAEKLGIQLCTVKAEFNRLYLKFGIKDGVKRVKLAVLLHQRSGA